MPRYEYKCTHCKDTFTISHMSDEKYTDCPKCTKKETLKKVLSSFTTKRKIEQRTAVGETTEQFIKDSRDELIQHKKELNRDR